MPKIAAALCLGFVVVSTGGARGTPGVSRPATQSSAATQATAPNVRGEKESGVLSDVLVLLLGTLLSLYATVVFERRKRFGEILRDVGRTRQHFQGYPVSPGPRDLEYAHTETVRFWHFLEEKEWELAADGHRDAAARINRLHSFFLRVATCIEKMQSKNTKGLAVDQYLMEFQSEYQRIYDSEFRRYESAIRPSTWALIRPLPHPVLPKSLTAYSGDDFIALL